MVQNVLSGIKPTVGSVDSTEALISTLERVRKDSLICVLSKKQ